MTELVTTLGGLEFRGELLSLPANGKGHDAALVDDEFVGIADGSTPLHSGNGIEAHGYARGALDRLRRHRGAPPVEMFRLALSTGRLPEAPISRLPSSTVITLTVIDEELTVSVLGDCLGLVKALDGDITVVCDRRLEQFDGPVAEQMARNVREGMSIDEAREAASEQLVSNRNRANSERAYWLFVDDPAAAEHVETASVPIADLDEIFLCSDGFSRLIEPFHIAKDEADLLTLAETRGLTTLGQELRSVEEAPNSFAEYPRLDPSDDATAILLRRA